MYVIADPPSMTSAGRPVVSCAPRRVARRSIPIPGYAPDPSMDDADVEDADPLSCGKKSTAWRM